MKQVIAILMILAGTLLGVYVGIWLCFIGGIIDVITQVRADEIDVTLTAIGVAKIVFAGLAGFVSAIVLVVPGLALLKK